MILTHGRKNRSFLDRFVFPLAIIFLNLSWLPSVPAATDCEKVADIPVTECNTLINLYNNTDGGHWSDSSSNNWNVTDTPCTGWAGIICSERHVTSIDRSKQNLSGSIPDLTALTNLQTLDLSANQLSGSIPKLSTLTNLQTLYLGINRLSGPIPDLSALTRLQFLDLSVNQLSGSIPDLTALTNLQTLDLSANQLSGSIPNLSTLTNLQTLYLGINRLSGPIPDLRALTRLQFLDLSANQLSGSIPGSLSDLTNLGELILGYNRLTTQDPKLLAFLANQRGISWADTQTIPPTDLQATRLSENSIQISWTPILYKDDGGYYQVKYLADSADPDQPYISATPTTDKNTDRYVVTDLLPNTTYYFVVETFTPAHDLQQNDLTSDLSIGISATTKALPNPSTPDPLPPTSDPKTPTSDPKTPTPDPSTPTPDPSTPTPDPSTPIQDPSTPIQDPSTQIQDPSTPIQDQSTPIKDPSTPIKDQSTPIKDPSTPIKDPSTPIQDPSTPIQDPLPIPIISTTPLPQTMNLIVRFSGNGHGRVTSNPSGINCNNSEPKCSYFPNTTSWVTLIATPAVDSEFAGWGGYQSDCNDGKVFMSDNRSCTAHFNLLRFPLTVTTVGKGKVNIASIGVECRDQCQYLVDMNTKVTLTAVPEADWQFETWQGDCDQNGQVTVNKEKQCQAVFVKVIQSTTRTTPTDTSNASPKLNDNQPILVNNCSNQTSGNCSATITSPPPLVKSEKTVPVIPTDKLKPSTETITSTENKSTVAVPHLLINPASYDFGKITVGNTSSAQVFTLTNIGEANLKLGQLTLPNQEFILTDACSNQTLRTGNQCSVTVIFQPQSVGIKTADLAIPTNKPQQDTITVIPLKGRGDVIVTVNPKAINLSRPLLVTFSSPLTAVVTSRGVELNWEIAATASNPIAAIHLWRAKSVNGDCPQDINQYDQRTARELKNEPHLDYQGTDTACYGLQTIEYSGEISWYITQAR